MTMTTLPLIERAAGFSARVAIHHDGRDMSYGQLLDASARAASALLDGSDDLAEARVAFLAPPRPEYVVAQWAIWRAGGIAVPLCASHPPPELDYVLEDTGASIVIASPMFEPALRPLAERRSLRFVLTSALDAPPRPLPALEPQRRAMILYTSGTTSKPKGVVSTHANIAAQITALTIAWGWTADDRILHVLPLHHIHGIVNVLGCALWSGATCEFMPKFDAGAVWSRFVAGDGLTLFMAVPTIYHKLIEAWESASAEQRQAMSAAAKRLRLMVSGSAALPVPVLEKWRAITGHTLLERYGMTEIGMALSNPLEGQRRPGCVGTPLPGVEVRLRDEHDADVPDGQPGEIQVRGPAVFGEYWQRPSATAASFTPDGFFKTGDVAVREDGVYRILGRASTDIIKTGGYKVSALEIEAVLLTHDAIDQCAVVGIEDAEWGERVCAAVVLRDGFTLDLESLRVWAKQRLAPYKVPRQLLALPSLPRNAMGKVSKKELTRLTAWG